MTGKGVYPFPHDNRTRDDEKLKKALEKSLELKREND